MTANHPTPVILSDEALAEIERALADSPCATFPMTTEEARALCQTVRALREQLYEEQRHNQVQAETIMRYESQLNHPAAAWADAPEHQENLAAKAKTLALLAREQAADQCTSNPDERETFLQGWDSATDYVRERFMEGSL